MRLCSHYVFTMGSNAPLDSMLRHGSACLWRSQEPQQLQNSYLDFSDLSGSISPESFPYLTLAGYRLWTK